MKRFGGLLLLPGLASAQPFVELGLGAPTGGCIHHQPSVCSEAPLGFASLGWELPKGFSIRWDHWSSLNTSKDRGMDTISVRWRYTFNFGEKKEEKRD